MTNNHKDRAFAAVVLNYLKQTGQEARLFMGGELRIGPSRRIARIKAKEADAARLAAAEAKRARKADRLRKDAANV